MWPTQVALNQRLAPDSDGKILKQLDSPLAAKATAGCGLPSRIHATVPAADVGSILFVTSIASVFTFRVKMKFRTYKNTDLTLSEVGFGLWTVSTGWWGNFTQGEAIALMHRAFDLGITLFDAADTYGNGLSEELIAKAFPEQRDEIVIATKVGYDFVHYGEARGRGQREIPQDFSPEAVTRATDAALKRLKTDRIDLLQLHNIRMEQVYDSPLWTTLEKLKSDGKIRYYGIALGPAVGWLYEGVNCIRERDVTSVQHIYNMLEQHPGRSMHEAATDAGKDTMFLIRVTHSSGMLEGKYTDRNNLCAAPTIAVIGRGVGC